MKQFLMSSVVAVLVMSSFDSAHAGRACAPENTLTIHTQGRSGAKSCGIVGTDRASGTVCIREPNGSWSRIGDIVSFPPSANYNVVVVEVGELGRIAGMLSKNSGVITYSASEFRWTWKNHPARDCHSIVTRMEGISLQ